MPSARSPRLTDWRPRLQAYLAEVTARPFAYGSHDCALFAAGAVQAMTGEDLARDYRGDYQSLKGGLKLLVKAGHADHVAVLRARFEEIAPAFAAVGDIAVIGPEAAPSAEPSRNTLGTAALGIFAGEHIAVLREDGLGFTPRTAAKLAFRVG
jgi:hypothetical protein